MKKTALLHDLISLVFPTNCLACGENLVQGEDIICLSCLYHIPKTNNQFNAENETARRFWGKVPVVQACAFYLFEKGSVMQKLLHALKYKGRKDIGIMLGKEIGQALKNSNQFTDIDLIIPVPLHKKRLAKRGYNQSACFGEGLASILEKPLDTQTLYRAIENPTQTKKGVYERWENACGIFQLTKPEQLANKHILLLDDVITTGSTLEACAQTLLLAKGTKVSILTIAVA